jgi:branched-subunit amino acid transport protein AzlD
MIDVPHSLALIAVVSLVTVAIRFLPFALFRGGRPIPKTLEYLGGVLPGAIMGMLVVYCFKSTVVTAWPFALPELIATAVVVGLYLWKRNTLLSIGVGTVLYMALVQLVFV